MLSAEAVALQPASAPALGWAFGASTRGGGAVWPRSLDRLRAVEAGEEAAQARLAPAAAGGVSGRRRRAKAAPSTGGGGCSATGGVAAVCAATGGGGASVEGRRLLDRRGRLFLDDGGGGVSGGDGGGWLPQAARRRLLGDWRRDRGWRRRLGRSRGGVLSGRRRGLIGRLRLFGRGRRCFRGRSLRLNVDDHFPRQFDRPGLQIDERKRGGVERDHDGDDKRAEPGRDGAAAARRPDRPGL